MSSNRPSGIESAPPGVWESTHAGEIERLKSAFDLTEREAVFVLRSSSGDVNAEAETYVALRDAGPSIHDYARVRRDLAELAAVREELRRQDLLDAERLRQNGATS